MRAWDCVPSFERARTFTAALADPGWHRWCYLRVCLPLSPWGSWTSDTPLCRSPRSQKWRDKVETHVGGPASARLGSQLKAILGVQTCEGWEPAGVPVPGVKSPPAIASSQMRPEVSWSRDKVISEHRIWEHKQNCCFTALRLGMICYAARVTKTASVSPRPMSTSSLQTWL